MKENLKMDPNCKSLKICKSSSVLFCSIMLTKLKFSILKKSSKVQLNDLSLCNDVRKYVAQGSHGKENRRPVGIDKLNLVAGILDGYRNIQ